MSSKVNVLTIVYKHWSTLVDARSGKTSVSDLFCFIGIPAAVFFLVVLFEVKLNSGTNSILVNFGSIFTALLLSVLVLVYDQRSKIDSNESSVDRVLRVKEIVLDQLFCNICYSILISIVMVVMCLISEIVGDYKWLVIQNFEYKNIVINNFEIIWKEYFFTPIILFLLTHLILTVFMVLKRLQSLLN